MRNCVRNLGETGLTMMALSAVESALWDLKARLLDISLVKLLGPFNSKIQAYGSGGFTTYSHTQLQKQLGRWSQDGFGKVKMKIGSRPDEDTARIKAAREAIGRNCELFVDANGAYSVKQAIDIAGCFERYDVSWYEEPVWHKDLCGLRRVRDNVGAGVNVAAGEYGFELTYFADMLKAGSVDILQADATRCGVSCFIQAASLCGANMIAMSSHCAPTLHLHICCSLPQVIHMEYFYDHVRIEGMLFDGAATADQGYLIPDIGRPGMGIELKEKDAEKYRTG
jgi:L-alanine-DL-glutamate epimerase-like enolase superfamily enzyme